MKKYLIASGICVFPVFILGVVNPIVVMMNNGKVKNETLFWIYILVLAVCLAVIMTTILLLQRYASKIDHMDEEERKTQLERERLIKLIAKYNNLISETQTTS